MADARYAIPCCCTPTGSHRTRKNGNNGSLPPERRYANTQLPPHRDRARRTITPQFGSHTLTVSETTAMPETARLRSLKGLLEPVAWKAGTAGSEGAPAQQCAGATRRARGGCHAWQDAA